MLGEFDRRAVQSRAVQAGERALDDEARLDLQRPARQVELLEVDAPAVGLEQPADHGDRRRLSRTRRTGDEDDAIWLADELAKLPEIRKLRTESSRLALSNLLKIYRFAPGEFDQMFNAMDKIGIPACRKYCSPLQALLWLIQDEKLSASGMLFGLEIEKITDEKGICRPHLISVLESPNGKTNSTGLDRHYTPD